MFSRSNYEVLSNGKQDGNTPGRKGLTIRVPKKSSVSPIRLSQCGKEKSKSIGDQNSETKARKSGAWEPGRETSRMQAKEKRSSAHGVPIASEIGKLWAAGNEKNP